MNLFLKNSFLLLCCAMAFSANAQVKYKASVVPSQINKDEYATVRLEIENAGNVQQLQPPSFKDFNVISGPNQEQGMSTINGVSKVYMAVSYVLQPKRAGKFTLGESAVTVSGKKYSSAPLKLVVKNETGRTPSGQAGPSFPSALFDVAEPARPSEGYRDYILKKGENVPDKVSRNMQLRLQTNKTSCFVGEPIIASYRLYTRLKSESKLTKAPSFNGFSVIDLLRPDDTEQSIEKLDGREYNVYTVRKSQLYPLQAGEIELEAATLDNNIQFIKEGVETQRMDGFLDGLGVSPDAVINQSVSLTSKPLTIHVKPLPEAGKPGSFNGAVGKFDISATLEKNKFGADESGKLLVTVSGAGNLQLITVPEITWPAGLEAFDPKVTDEYDQATVPVSGKKTFSIPFTVNAKGSYRIPTIRFSYFDPTTASYKIDSTGPIDFTVVQGSTQPAYDIDTLSQKKSISLSQQIFSHREWIVGVIALLMVLGLYGWNRREKKTTVSLEKKDDLKPETFAPVSPQIELQEIVSRPQNPLQKTEECLNSTDCTEFYTLLNAEFKTWLATKFSLGLPEVNSKKIISSFDKAGIDNDTSLKVQHLLQDIEWQLYTPFERNDSMHQLYSRAQSVLQTIDSYHQTATL